MDMQLTQIPTHHWSWSLFFTSIVATSLPREKYNESGQPPLKFSKLPDVQGWRYYLHWHQGAQFAQWQCSCVHHLSERHTPMGQCKHQVCCAGSGRQPGLSWFDHQPLPYDVCVGYPVQCCSKIEHSAMPHHVLMAKLRAHFTIWW